MRDILKVLTILVLMIATFSIVAFTDFFEDLTQLWKLPLTITVVVLVSAGIIKLFRWIDGKYPD